MGVPLATHGCREPLPLPPLFRHVYELSHVRIRSMGSAFAAGLWMGSAAAAFWFPKTCWYITGWLYRKCSGSTGSRSHQDIGSVSSETNLRYDAPMSTLYRHFDTASILPQSPTDLVRTSKQLDMNLMVPSLGRLMPRLDRYWKRAAFFSGSVFSLDTSIS